MRTKIYTTALITLMILTNTLMAFATAISFEEETYIDDIPFNTEAIFEDLTLETSFTFEPEVYVDDIPFNTFEIASGLDSIRSDFEDDAYIDDIPFDTQQLAATYNYYASLDESFDFEEEDYVDDIPFNTELIAEKIVKDYNKGYFEIAILSIVF